MAELADAPDLGSGGSHRGGSSPFTRTICGSGSVVEHRLAKARVASSNLVFRSIKAEKLCKNLLVNGVWLSLVEYVVWDHGAGGSNPSTPTIYSFK